MTTEATIAAAVYRIEVHPADVSDDPVGRNVFHEATEAGLAAGLQAVRSARVFLIQGDLEPATVERIAGELLADPINQRYVVGGRNRDDAATVEVHYLPGVMDPVAMSTQDAIDEMLDEPDGSAGPSRIEVRTGFRYDFVGLDGPAAETVASRLLANTVIQKIETGVYHPEAFVTGQPYALNLTHVPIRDLDDEALGRMSREAHLFLSLEEMQGIRDYYRSVDREPTDIELETLAQTWSEHCVHKTLKSKIRYRENPKSEIRNPKFAGRPGHTINEDGSITIDNLLKSTIAAATNRADRTMASTGASPS
jgi:phosphoribosylformylglycinamidine (FGAM) synthase PurS component